MRRIALILATGLLAAAAAGGPAAAAPSATGAQGVVVQRGPTGGSFVLASARGALVPVLSPAAPRVGTRVAVAGSRAPGGPLRASSVRRSGAAGGARVRGTVVALAARSRRYVVTGPGAAIVVRAGHGRPLPAIGDVVLLEVSFGSGGTVRADALRTGGHRSRLTLSGTLVAVDPEGHTLELVLDAAQGPDFLPPVVVRGRAGDDLGGCAPGDPVTLAARHDPAAGYVALTDPGCDVVAGEDGVPDPDPDSGEPGGEGPGVVEVGNGLEDDGGASRREREVMRPAEPEADPGP
jgi:hypothetical protein